MVFRLLPVEYASGKDKSRSQTFTLAQFAQELNTLLSAVGT